MYGKPTNHALVQKTMSLMFGDSYGPFLAAAQRTGNVPVAFVLSESGRDLNASVETIAALWAAKLDQPIDYGLIELIVAARDRVMRNPLLMWRVGRGMKKAGIFPPTELAA